MNLEILLVLPKDLYEIFLVVLFDFYYTPISFTNGSYPNYEKGNLFYKELVRVAKVPPLIVILI